MAAEQSQRADRLGDAVEAFLAFTSGGEGTDPAAFLARHEPLRDLLEPMLADGAAAAAPPTRLGDYEIVREIGRGGMGVVYEARQPSLQRSVAIKVLWSHLTLSESRVARFKREAAATAKLGHPGIVRVHEVGEAAGAHFFAMELVAGDSLARRLERSPDPRQPLGALPGKSAASEAAALCVEIAGVLQHAHERGVIHRDVKPGNILLEEGPQGATARLVDFGLAKDLDQETLSRSGELFGTPHYMSPEQAQAGRVPVDARTDVWSLGVVLYEMLTRRRPFDGDTAHTILLQIAHREPLLPRRQNPDLPRDLETICLKAIEKDPERRYATAGAMAEDLRRFLDHRPILARSQGPVTRAIKLARRRPAAAAAIGLGALLVAATLVFLIELRSTGDAARRAQAQARTYLSEVLAAIGAPLDRAIQPDPGQAPPPIEASREVVESALRRCEAFVAAHGEDPAVRAECLDLYRGIAGAYRSLGMMDRAALSVRRGLELAKGLESAPDSRRVAEGMVPRLLSELSVALGEQGQFAEAEQCLREGIQRREAYLQQPEAADRERVRRDLVWELASLGRLLLSEQHRRDEAERALVQAQQEFDALGSAASHPLAQRTLVHLHNGLSALHNARGRTKDALRSLQAAAEACAKISAAFPGNLDAKCDHALSLANFAALLTARRPAEARVHLETAVRLADEALAAQPANPRHQRLAPHCEYLLAKCLERAGDPEAARQRFQSALTRQAAVVAAQAKRVELVALLAAMNLNFGWFLERIGEEEAAERHLEAALAAHETALGLEPAHEASLRHLASCGEALATWWQERGQPARARSVLDRTIDLERRALEILAKTPTRQALAGAVRDQLRAHEAWLVGLAEGSGR